MLVEKAGPSGKRLVAVNENAREFDELFFCVPCHEPALEEQKADCGCWDGGDSRQAETEQEAEQKYHGVRDEQPGNEFARPWPRAAVKPGGEDDIRQKHPPRGFEGKLEKGHGGRP